MSYVWCVFIGVIAGFFLTVLLGINPNIIPLSGTTELAKNDLIVKEMPPEVKAQYNELKELCKWIEDKDLLFIKIDKEDYLCVMQLDTFAELLKRIKEEEK